MDRRRTTAFAGSLVAAALIGGMLISAVAAAPGPPAAADSVAAVATATPAPSTNPGAKYCQDFRAAFAKNLGVTEDEVVAAAKAAIISTLDAAVADGSRGADAAAKAKTFVEGASGDACSLLSGWKGKIAHVRSGKVRVALGIGKSGLDAAAQAVGLTVKELHAELKTGKSLKDVAAATGIDYDVVSAAVLRSVQGSVDELVKAGKITQERADKALADTKERLAEGWVHERKRDRSKPSSTPAP
jgi:hypothetical protein